VNLDKAIFLDRDGVLNQSYIVNGKPFAPRKLNDFKFVDDVENAIKILKSTGYYLIVVTNQPDVGNGLMKKEIVESMNNLMMTRLGLDAVKVCYHSQKDECDCRKPKPGMLLESSRELGIDLKESFLIGDRKGDIVAGKSVGCYSIFIDNGYSKSEQPSTADFVASNIKEAASHILSYIT